MIKFNYPNFHPKNGNFTKTSKINYLKWRINNNSLHKNLLYDNKTLSLIASNNINDELFFWQLYSILGLDKIYNIVYLFYLKIFSEQNNEYKWFKDKFIEAGDLNYHIKGQLSFWLDIMGGGIFYYKDEYNLNQRHYMVKVIMNKEGAELWLKYMSDTLGELEIHKLKDERIIKCFKSFLNYFMITYSEKFDFTFKKLESKL